MQPIIELFFAGIYRLRGRHFCKFQRISYSKAGFRWTCTLPGDLSHDQFLLQSASNPTNDIILSRCDTSFIFGHYFKCLGYSFEKLPNKILVSNSAYSRSPFLGCLQISMKQISKRACCATLSGLPRWVWWTTYKILTLFLGFSPS